jgi:hypothetical protein
MQVPSHFKDRDNDEKGSIKLQIEFARNQLFKKEEVDGRGHHV